MSLPDTAQVMYKRFKKLSCQKPVSPRKIRFWESVHAHRSEEILTFFMKILSKLSSLSAACFSNYNDDAVFPNYIQQL